MAPLARRMAPLGRVGRAISCVTAGARSCLVVAERAASIALACLYLRFLVSCVAWGGARGHRVRYARVVSMYGGGAGGDTCPGVESYVWGGAADLLRIK